VKTLPDIFANFLVFSLHKVLDILATNSADR